MGIFLDTSFFLGLVHPKDINHQRSIEMLKRLSEGEFGIVYSSDFVISETATILLIRTQNNALLIQDFFDLVYGKDCFVKIISWSSALEMQTWHIFQTHNKNAKSKKEYLSFVDASNISICRKHNFDYIVAYDGDFDSYLIRVG